MRNGRAYRIWACMKNRCSNPNNSRYHCYGGRGIQVCERWLSFDNFYEDMGEPPIGHTLNRIDNEGDYCKDNCNWATPLEQANNTRRNAMVSYEGKTQSLAEWARELDLPYRVVKSRYAKGRKPPELFSKERLPSPTKYIFTYKGKTQSLAAWAEELGIKYGTLAERCRLGYTPPELFSPHKLNHDLLTYNGKTQSIAAWAREVGLSYGTLMQRYQQGWEPPKLFTQESLRGKTKGKNKKYHITYEGKEVSVKEFAELTGMPLSSVYTRMYRGEFDD